MTGIMFVQPEVTVQVQEHHQADHPQLLIVQIRVLQEVLHQEQVHTTRAEAVLLPVLQAVRQHLLLPVLTIPAEAVAAEHTAHQAVRQVPVHSEVAAVVHTVVAVAVVHPAAVHHPVEEDN